MDNNPTPSRHTEPRERKEGTCVPSGAPAWVTDELIQLTLDTFDSHYEKPLKPEDALEILLNATNLMELIK